MAVKQKKSVKKSESVTDTSGNSPIRRANKFYIKLAGYGQIGANGRPVISLDQSPKRIEAPVDRPLSLVAMMLQEMLPLMDYSSKEAAAKDVAVFQKFVASFKGGG